jgi:hypothetical protein
VKFFGKQFRDVAVASFLFSALPKNGPGVNKGEGQSIGRHCACFNLPVVRWPGDYADRYVSVCGIFNVPGMILM